MDPREKKGAYRGEMELESNVRFKMKDEERRKEKKKPSVDEASEMKRTPFHPLSPFSPEHLCPDRKTTVLVALFRGSEGEKRRE